MKANWIKMYDKHGCVLRVEMVINDPDEFKVVADRRVSCARALGAALRTSSSGAVAMAALRSDGVRDLGCRIVGAEGALVCLSAQQALESWSWLGREVAE